jgi:beta-glucanase (GH16 family)
MTKTVKLDRSAWQLVWRDEFNGPAGAPPDSSKWRPDIGDGCSFGICGWGNDEKQYYTNSPDDVALDGRGNLRITARKAESDLKCHYGRCLYTSGKITTRGIYNAEPGLVEARIRVPTGQGLWPAFWMLGRSHMTVPWPQSGEIDIMEHRGSQPAIMSSAIHGPGYSGQTIFADAKKLRRGGFPDRFHRFGAVWDSTSVQFFIDDTLYYRANRPDVEKKGKWVFDQPFYILLNLAVGGHFDGDPKSDAVLPATMLVDYVRVYRRRE